MAQIVDKVKSLFGFGSEGSWRGPFSGQDELGGWHTLGRIEDGFQRDLSIRGNGARFVPAAYAGVMANAKATSQCSATHVIRHKTGKREVQLDGAVAEVLRSPNAYQTWNQWILNAVALMLFEGESFHYVLRDKRGNIIEIHPMASNTCSPYVDETGSVFYSMGGNPMLSPDTYDALIPARDILHFRAHTPRHPLIGESPLTAAAIALGINVTLSQTQAQFFSRMSRPSGIISTDQTLTRKQIEELRGAWEDQAAGMAKGGIPILGGGMKFEAMGITSQDAQLIEAQRLSIEDIARVLGVPLPIIGDLTNSTLSNVEELVNMWLSIGLGSLLENVEASLEKLFDLPPNESIELDESALLRTNFEGRINGLTRAVQGGIYTINEAREKEGLHAVEHGDKPIVQMQMVPLGTPPSTTPAPTEPTEPEPTEPTPEPEEDTKALREIGRGYDMCFDKNMSAEDISNILAEKQLEDRAQIEALAAQYQDTIERLEAALAKALEVKDGTNGVDGQDGTNGVDGTNGEKGTDGTNGTNGIDGQDGEKGEAGEAGEKGTDGVDGEKGADGQDGEKGADGQDGLGLETKAWTKAIHLEGEFVTHHNGQFFKALENTSEEPGDSKSWIRVGLAGTRHCGTFKLDKNYAESDQFVKDFATFQIMKGEAFLINARGRQGAKGDAVSKSVIEDIVVKALANE